MKARQNPPHRAAAACLAAAACTAVLLTAGCGGGGGGGAPTAEPGATAQSAGETTLLASFKSILSSDLFAWATAQQPAANLRLARASGQPVGAAVKLHLSNFICLHPDVGSLANPMATDSLMAYPVHTDEAAALTVNVNLAGLQLPDATTQVLVEVVENNSTLYSKRHSVASLADLQIVFPDSTPMAEDTVYIDACN